MRKTDSPACPRRKRHPARRRRPGPAESSTGQAALGILPAYKKGAKRPPASPIRITLRRADELVPYPRNARKHSDAHIAEVMGSMLEFGWTQPILADEFIRAGH